MYNYQIVMTNCYEMLKMLTGNKLFSLKKLKDRESTNCHSDKSDDAITYILHEIKKLYEIIQLSIPYR